MDNFTKELIARQKNSLHRTPPPRPPQGKSNNVIQDTENETQTPPFQFKLKKTGFRESLISDDLVIHKDVVSGEPPSEVQTVIAKRRAMFEAQEPNVGVKPKPKPKPKAVVRSGKEEKAYIIKPRTDSCSSNSEQTEMENDAGENVVFDDARVGTTLQPLPTLQCLGKPPPKRPKPVHLRSSLEKFNKDNIVVAPRRATLRSDAEETDAGFDVSPDVGEDFYDDVEEELKDQLLGNHKQEVYNKDQTQVQEDSGILEECYDDVEEITAKANGINSQQEQSSGLISEESYDDISTVAEEVQQLNNNNNNNNDFNEGVSEEFGEEFYEPLMENEDEGVRPTGGESPLKNKTTTMQAPSIPNRQEDQKKGDTKEQEKKDKKEIEMQKKREKEEQKKMKEEQKRRDREEREEKKKREREDKELRKKHKIKVGCEGRGVGVAKNDFSGDGKYELPVKEGDSLVVICEENCPPGKWLIKNSDGHLGYVPTELIKLQVDSHGNRISMTITEDLYEDVDQYQSRSLGVPSTPPPVPSAHPSNSAVVEPIEEEAVDEDFYDDIGGQEAIDDDFYEELPADQ